MTTEPVDPSLSVRIKIGHQPRYLLALLWISIAVFGFIFLFANTNVLIYFLVALLACGAAGLAILTLPQFNYLELHRRGFTLRQFRETTTCQWRDVQEIVVFSWREKEMIGLKLWPTVVMKNDTRGQKNKWPTYDLVLTAHYELAPQEVVDMMNAYRAHL